MEGPAGCSSGLLSGWEAPHVLAPRMPTGLFLLQDLGLEGTFLNEVLYKNATFLNLVDPISHDLLMSLARDLQCPKKVKPFPSSKATLPHSTEMQREPR